MSARPSISAHRIVQLLLLLQGALLLVYAIADHPLYGGEPGFGATQMLIAAAGAGLVLGAFLSAAAASRLLVLSTTTLLMLGFAELAGELALGARLRPVYQADERLIFKFIPGRQNINSAGFRGDELRPAGEATRVVVYGDSFIHAYYSPQEETFAARLGALLSERLGGRLEVVNAGVSSYGPDQVSLKMEQELPWLRADLVVVAVFAGNDYGDLVRNKLFRLDSTGALVENAWRLDPQVRLQFALSQRESILKRALRNVLDGAKPGTVNMDFLLAEAEREYRSFVLERDDVVSNTHVDYYSADVSLTPGAASARYKVALMEAVLRRIRDVAARHGAPLAFLFIPHPVDVAEHYDWAPIERARFPEYHGRNQIAPLERAARTLGVPFVSLYDLYRKHDANSLYFHGGDDHWNAAGQRLAAEALADYLLRQGLLGHGA